jgi:hypothetical protein
MPTTLTRPIRDAACPPESDLRGLLSAELIGDRSMEVTDHLGGCSHCQDAMERFATGETPALSEALLHIEAETPRFSASPAPRPYRASIPI